MESCKRRTKPPKKTLSEYRGEFDEEQIEEWREACADWHDDPWDTNSLFGGSNDWLDFADTSKQAEQFDPHDHYHDDFWYDDDLDWPDDFSNIDINTNVSSPELTAPRSLGEILQETYGELGL